MLVNDMNSLECEPAQLCSKHSCMHVNYTAKFHARDTHNVTLLDG